MTAATTTAALVDVHCHLCAGLDDGPRTLDEAVEMCRIAHGEGVHWIAATAHQNETWPGVTPAGIAVIGCLGGIGFTMSIFIAMLAFEEPELLSVAKFGVLAGSVCAAATGLVAGRLLLRPASG